MPPLHPIRDKEKEDDPRPTDLPTGGTKTGGERIDVESGDYADLEMDKSAWTTWREHREEREGEGERRRKENTRRETRVARGRRT